MLYAAQSPPPRSQSSIRNRRSPESQEHHRPARSEEFGRIAAVSPVLQEAGAAGTHCPARTAVGGSGVGDGAMRGGRHSATAGSGREARYSCQL